MTTIFVSLLICLSADMSAQNRNTMAAVAHARGYSVLVGEGEACAVEVLPGSQDLAGSYLWTVDALRGRKLSKVRANDLITSWESRL